MLVAVQLSVPGLYLPPVFKSLPLDPPQTIISVLAQTAVWLDRASGALPVLVAVQLSVLGLYLPPVFKELFQSAPLHPLKSMTESFDTAVGTYRASVALGVLVVVELWVHGLYLPALLDTFCPAPPQTIISLPVQTAV